MKIHIHYVLRLVLRLTLISSSWKTRIKSATITCRASELGKTKTELAKVKKDLQTERQKIRDETHAEADEWKRKYETANEKVLRVVRELK